MKVWINNVFYQVNAYYTIFQFCLLKNINLPCFCYHEKLTIAGNCRICLVEANSSLVVSCALPLLDGMKIFTDNKRVRLARESVLQFLLVNHPLDCPICDQGGECDLQDISLTFGLDRGRFYEYKKRAYDNLNCCGPLIKTVMTRCIHCSRCVRFINEVSGLFDLGILGRGSAMEIGTFIEKFLDDELSGNIIDLCPVGALTSMPYAFSARTWELSSFSSVDILDSLASSLRLDVINNKVIRVVPSLDESVNEDWITNKARFVYDSFSMQRLYYPKLSLYSKMVVISWRCVFHVFFDILIKHSFRTLDVFCGSFSDYHATTSLKHFFNSMGCSNVSFSGNSLQNTDFSTLIVNSLEDLNFSRNVLLLATNTRLESPLINARLRKLFLNKKRPCFFYSVGMAVNFLTFPVVNLGNSVQSFSRIFASKSNVVKRFFTNDFFNSSFLNKTSTVGYDVSFLLGEPLLKRPDAFSLINAIFGFISRASKFANKINFFPVSASLGRIVCHDLALLSKSSRFQDSQASSKRFTYLYKVDSIDSHTKGGFLVSQQSFSNSTFFNSKATLLLPSRLFVEQKQFFLNLEGRVRATQKAITAFSMVPSDYKVIFSLFLSGKFFFPSNFSIVSNFYNMASFFSNILSYDAGFLFSFKMLYKKVLGQNRLNLSRRFGISSELLYLVPRKIHVFINSIFSRFVNNFYEGNLFCQNSKTLTLCSLKSAPLNFSKIN